MNSEISLKVLILSTETYPKKYPFYQTSYRVLNHYRLSGACEADKNLPSPAGRTSLIPECAQNSGLLPGLLHILNKRMPTPQPAGYRTLSVLTFYHDHTTILTEYSHLLTVKGDEYTLGGTINILTCHISPGLWLDGVSTQKICQLYYASDHIPLLQLHLKTIWLHP